MYVRAINILNKFTQCSNLLDLMRVLIISEFIRWDGEMSEAEIDRAVRAKKLHQFLARYNIPPIDLNNEPSISAQIFEVSQLIPNTMQFQLFVHDAFPYTFKSNAMIEQLKGNPLHLYTAVYVMLSCSASYVGMDVTRGKLFIDLEYVPRDQMWNSLGIPDIDTFTICWQSMHYYCCCAQNMFIPGILREAIDAYQKYNIPKTVLLSHFVRLLSCRDSLQKGKQQGSLFNPWQECRKIYSLPMIERGMTRNEELFNNSILQLISSKVQPTDVVNGLFYKKRSDALVETNILFPAIQMDVEFAQQILVINPSPDFLVAYSNCSLTAQKNTTFVVTDGIIAEAYGIQFADRSYKFVTSKCFAPALHSESETVFPVFDYVIVMARDSSLRLFSDLISQCKINGRLIAFLPQTMLTSKTDENLVGLFNACGVFVDSILELPNALSESGKRKKMILRAHVAKERPPYFALISTSHSSPDHAPSKQIRGVNKERSNQRPQFMVRHYTILDRITRKIPYSMLDQHYTIKQMRDYYDRMILQKSDEKKKTYTSGQIYPFSKDVGITLNLYQQPDGRYKARAYRRFESAEYGHSKRNGAKRADKKPPGSIRTDYYETGPCSLEKIYSRINQWVLRPNIMELIVRDLEANYANSPHKLSLKTVWYCNRVELQTTYMTYDDELAIQLFCGESQQLSDLSIDGIDKGKVLEALALTVPNSTDDQRYLRLLDLIFRIAVKRGFLETHPFMPEKMSLEHELKKAMRQLRDALGKDSLEFGEIRNILLFLFEPVDDRQTPRAVKESCWIVPLIRLCTGMPLREICALKWKDFRQIDLLNAYQLYVTHLVNDSNEPVHISNYRYVKQLRKVPCVTLLSTILNQRLQYLQDTYGIPLCDVMDQPIIYEAEPNIKRARKKKTMLQCTIRRARQVSLEALAEAKIPSDVISLLEGEAAFQEDLNAFRNDLYYSNFLHYVNNLCGLSEGEICYIVGRKGPNCFSEHYVDYRNDFMQLDMLLRMDRLWALVWPTSVPAEYTYTTSNQNMDHTIKVYPCSGALASADVSIVPISPFDDGDVRVHVECEHGVNAQIIVYTKEFHT